MQHTRVTRADSLPLDPCPWLSFPSPLPLTLVPDFCAPRIPFLSLALVPLAAFLDPCPRLFCPPHTLDPCPQLSCFPLTLVLDACALRVAVTLGRVRVVQRKKTVFSRVSDRGVDVPAAERPPGAGEGCCSAPLAPRAGRPGSLVFLVHHNARLFAFFGLVLVLVSLAERVRWWCSCLPVRRQRQKRQQGYQEQFDRLETTTPTIQPLHHYDH